MKQYILFILFCIPLLGSCQEKYNQEPYDDFEVLLRTSDIDQISLTISTDWQKRDSLSYLRFKDNVVEFYIIGIDSLPEWINQFKRLESFIIIKDDSVTLPDCIDKFKNLEILNLGDNTFVKNIKPTITNLSKLEILNASNLSSDNPLLNSLDKFPKLSKLSLSYIDSIPIYIYI